MSPSTPRTTADRWRRRTAAATATVLTCALATACGAGQDRDDAESPADRVGVTDDTIKVGGHFPLTGVAAPGYSEIPSGHQAFYDFVNAEGGVGGREIEFVAKDDAYNPTNTTQVTNELVLSDEIFGMVGGLGTPTHGAAIDFLNDEGVPDLFVSSGSRQWGETPEEYPMTFGWQPDYVIEGKVMGQWIAENMPDARVGLLLQDDDLGADGEAGVREFIDDQIVEVVSYTPSNTDIAPQLAQLQAADVDLVIGFSVPSFTALSQLVALRLGFDPQWMYTNVGSDPSLVGSLLATFSEGAVADGASLLDGVITTEYIPGVDAPEDPWVQLWQRVWDEYGEEGEPLTNYRIYGMSQAYTLVQALQAAGDDLTREGVVAAIEEAGGDFEGPGLAPFRYSADSHLGLSGMRVVQLEGGVGQPLTPVLTSDLGDAEVTEDESAAGDAPPESGIPDVEPVG
ncbi:ABC transporter substrate-binding protein [Nocardioides sp. ChNu-153]|uniref:ABC transporter substrate-binding protein n=1 Tax=unclassified Nocardioides TaxID=2615069 RepID=UPI0024074DD6|nr:MULTISPECIES: ABC transporter substrate-binding protein [unclassified Nocardioides]MDF9714810.1 ABC transporter substrate-binding protein [Nocardioides sp. ChNu-99]MDN7120064.1 ABC transporter substrate-binding protein [Nocardioides sp. ChNu-153]